MFINKPPKNQQLNIRFFLPFTILMVIIVISLTSILYYNYQETTLPIIYDQISENLQQSGNSATYMMESVNNLLSQMSLDSKITTLMYSPGTHDALELRSGQKALTSYMYASPFVHSIYVYNSNTDSFFTSLPNLGLQEAEQFFDDDIISIIDTYDTSKRLTPIPRQVKLSTPFAEQRYIDCYTFIYFETLKDGRIKDAIIVNVDQSYVADLLSIYETDAPNIKLLIDNNDTVILNTTDYELLEDISGEPFVQTIRSKNKSQGYFVTSVNHNKSLISYSTLQIPSWTFINITPFDYLSGRLIRLRIVSLIIALFLLLFGVITSTLLSRYKYRPIKRVLDNVSTLEANSRRNYYDLRQATLRKLIQSDVDDLQKTDIEPFNLYKIQVNLHLPSHLLLLSIDDYRSFNTRHSQEDIALTKFSIINIVNEIIGRDYPCESIDMLDDNFLVVLNGRTKDKLFDKEHIHKLNLEIIDTISQLLKVSVTIINGPSAATKISLIDAYSDMNSLLEYRLLYGIKSIIDYDEIANKELEPYELDREQSKKLVDYVITGKYDEAYEFYNLLIEAARNNTAESIKYLHIQLAFALNGSLSYIRSHNNNNEIPDLGHLFETINTTATLDELALIFRNYFKSVAELVALVNQPKHNELSDKISSFIQNHYMDINLSLNMVADFLNMSPMYTGRLFKQQTGTSISNHINAVRLVAAEDILKNTNHSINEIAVMIGVNNSNYFYSLFKKKHGVTPSVYRKSHITKVD